MGPSNQAVSQLEALVLPSLLEGEGAGIGLLDMDQGRALPYLPGLVSLALLYLFPLEVTEEPRPPEGSCAAPRTLGWGGVLVGNPCRSCGLGFL